MKESVEKRVKEKARERTKERKREEEEQCVNVYVGRNVSPV